MKPIRKTTREIVAEFIKNYREKLGLSQSEFGALIDRDRQYVSKAENCVNEVTGEMLDRLRKYLGLEYQEILKND